MASRMIQNNFSGGEISPSLFGRSDLQAYYKGCENAENFVVSKEGTLRKRHGISSFMELPKPFARCKVVPYKYDRSEGGFLLIYILDDSWTDGDTNTPTTIRVKFYDKVGNLHTWQEVLDGSNTEITYRDIAGFKGFIKDFQYKQIGDEVWITNGELYRILRVVNNEKFNVVEWEQTGVPDKIPYNSINNRTITHWTVTRSSYESGEQISMKTLNYGLIGVRDSVNSETVTSSVSFPAIWQAGTYIDIDVTISVDDLVGKWDYIAVAKRTGGSYGELTRFYLADDPDEYYGLTSASTPALKRIYKWENGHYYDREEGSTGTPVEFELKFVRFKFRDENHSPSDLIYAQTNVLGKNFTTPRCVDCFQQRRVFANATNDKGKLPMTLWFSEVGNLNNFYSDRPVAEDDAFSPSIASSGPAFILFIVTYQEMMILFTESGLFSLGFSQQSGFSSNSCRVSKFSDLSCSPDIQPVVTEAGVVFVGADNKTVYSISYSLQENMLKPINRTVLVEHLTRKHPVKAIALQDYPDNVVWVVTDDGKLCSFTVEKNEDVYSWSHSRIKDSNFLDVISIGTCTDSTTDRTYGDLVFVVEGRDGTQYLCRQNEGYSDIIGEDETNVCATLSTLRAESQERTIVGFKKNIKDVLVRLYETGRIAVRSPDKKDITLVEAKMDGSLFSGDVKVMPRGVVNPDGCLELVSDNDLPCEVLQIVIDMEITG